MKHAELLRIKCLSRWPLRRGRRRFARLLNVTCNDIPDGELVNSHPLGLCFRTHPDDVYFDLSYFKEYERFETELMLKLLRPGDSVFDVGANFGWFSLHALKSDPQRHVWAFEPQTELCEEIRSNMALNDLELLLDQKLHILNLAVGSSRGKLTLNKLKSASHALTTSFAKAEQIESTFTVPIRPLDEILMEVPENLWPAFVKCDVEGAEMEVLRGSHKLCSSPSKPVWLLEINLETSGCAGWVPADMIAFLEAHGYTDFFFLSHANRPRLVRSRKRPVDIRLQRNGNIVALDGDAHSWQMQAMIGRRPEPGCISPKFIVDRTSR